MQRLQSDNPNVHLWAGASAPAPQAVDPFPMRDFFRWFRIGLAGLVLLILIFAYLEGRASKQIVYLMANGSLGVVRADGVGERSLQITGLEGANIGPPQWSPRGGRFASVVESPSGTALLVARSSGQVAAQIPLIGPREFKLPSKAWASGGNHVAVINASSEGTDLQIVDLTQNRAFTVSLNLGDTQVAWHPQRDEILITVLAEGGGQTLQVVPMGGQVSPFTPDDQFTYRSQGVWSPNGNQVAYIATTTLTDTNRPLIVANADGSAPSVVVADGQNSFPMWAPRGDLIVFTRFISETNEYILYRVRPNGEEIQPIGRGLPPEFAANNIQGAVSWSPDWARMLFQSYNSSTREVALSIASYDGSNPQALLSERDSGAGVLSALWSPTSRGILVADERGMIRMRWLNSEESQIFTEGRRPSWEP